MTPFPKSRSCGTPRVLARSVSRNFGGRGADVVRLRDGASNNAPLPENGSMLRLYTQASCDTVNCDLGSLVWTPSEQSAVLSKGAVRTYAKQEDTQLTKFQRVFRGGGADRIRTGIPLGLNQVPYR